MESPNYYGIIPANVRYDENLTLLEKFLYCEFTALSNLNGYCYSKNEYFGKLYNKDKATISRAISHLEELKYIYIEYEKQGARVTKRRIYPLDVKSTNDKIVNCSEITDDKNVTREQQKLVLTVDKIVKDNNSSYEDIIKLIIESLKKNKKESEIIEEFNFTQATIEVINIWLKYKKEKNQGYKETGFRTLLNKIKDWENKFGSQYILDAVNYSMANNYIGVFPQKQKTEKNIHDFQERKYTKEQFNSFMDDLDNIEI